MLAEKLLLGVLQAIHVSDTGRDFSWPAPSPEYLFQGIADRFLRERNAVKAFSANHKMPPAGTTLAGLAMRCLFRWGVIIPFLVALQSRAYAASLRFIAGVMPPMPMFGRSLLYVHSQAVANPCISSRDSKIY